MAYMDVVGLDSMARDLEVLVNAPDSVMDNMLNAAADVLVEAQRAEIAAKWRGKYSMGISAKSVKKDKPGKGWEGRRSITVFIGGRRKRGKQRVRNAEIAFMNEYGAPKRGIAARPAISVANEKAADKAVDASEKVYRAYLDSKNL